MARPVPKIYSYLRFSTKPQEWGDSEVRQLELFSEFVTEFNSQRAREDLPALALDDSLRDLGVSGTGPHVAKGVLGPFLESVKRSEIAPGSYLIVEDVSRLGRAGFDFMYERVLSPLWKHGITIEFLRPRLSAPPGTSKKMEVFLPIYVELERVAKFSEDLSRRIRGHWKRKREGLRDGKKLGGQHPAWITPVYGESPAKGKAKPVVGFKKAVDEKGRKAEDAIHEMFRLRLEGMTFEAIVLAMSNPKAGWWRPPPNDKNKDGGYQMKWVQSVLKPDRRLLGELQPRVYRKDENGRRTNEPDGDPVPDYYPAVIDLETFKALEAWRSREKKWAGGGRNDKAGNLFTKLIKCGYCESPVHRFGERSLRCSKVARGECASTTVSYREVERLVIANLVDLGLDDIVPDPERSTQEIQRLTKEAAALGREVEEAEERRARLMRRYAEQEDDEVADLILKEVKREEAERAEKLKLKTEAEVQLETATRSRRELDAAREELGSIADALQLEENRFRAQARLRQLLEKIEIFSVGFIKSDEDEFDDYLREVAAETDPALLRSRKFKTFVKWVMARRRSKAGRFIRLRFRNGGKRTVVPPGSIASGYRWEEADPSDSGDWAGWATSEPDLDKLWAQWEASAGKGVVA